MGVEDCVQLPALYLGVMNAARAFQLKYRHYGEHNQISLQRPRDIADTDPLRFRLANGTLTDSGRYKMEDFSELYPETQWVKPLLDEIEMQSGMRAVRARLMTLEPKTCLSLHRDTEEYRYHLVIKTSPEAFFVVDDQVHRMPNEGCLYRLRVNGMHTAVNANKHGKRTHIVVCVA